MPLYFLSPGIHSTYAKVNRFMQQFKAGLRSESLRRASRVGRIARLLQAGLEERRGNIERQQEFLLEDALPEDSRMSLDLDYLSIPILPQCLPLFADWWQVGGSSVRSDGLPDGLEIANSPYTLRVQVPGGSKARKQSQIGAVFLEELQRDEYMHPVLMPPKSKTDLHIALHSRPMDSDVLARLLTRVLDRCEGRLVVCGYGYKMPAQRFYEEVLTPTWHEIRRSLELHDQNAYRCHITGMQQNRCGNSDNSIRGTWKL